jgi:hypothetical protein
MKNRMLSLLFVFSACQAPSQDALAPDVTSGGDAVIGGFAGYGENLRAVGSITLHIAATGEIFGFCTGTLIAPQIVLTAKHCILNRSNGYSRYLDSTQFDMFFGIGNSHTPTQSVRIVDAATAPLMLGGPIGYGSDVGVYYLQEPITGITPLPFQSPVPDMIGKKATVIGYGAQNNLEAEDSHLRDGNRDLGAITIGALHGNYWDLVVGSYEAFIQYMSDLYWGKEKMDACLADPKCSADLFARYHTADMIDGYEVWAAKKSGDAEPCYGDSGGPLLEAVTEANGSSRLVILGVTSYVTNSPQLACDYGAMYATFGPSTADFLQQAMTWTDPCAGITAECSGTVATRCSGKNEGPRRVLSMNCAAIQQTCVMEGNRATCTGEALTPPTTQEPADIAAMSDAMFIIEQ